MKNCQCKHSKEVHLDLGPCSTEFCQCREFKESKPDMVKALLLFAITILLALLALQTQKMATIQYETELAIFNGYHSLACFKPMQSLTDGARCVEACYLQYGDSLRLNFTTNETEFKIE